MRIHCVALTLLLTTTSTTAFALTPHTAWIHQKRISFTANFQDSRRNIDSVEDAARVCRSMKLHNNMANSADDDADAAAEGRAVAVREQMLARRLQLGAAAAAENCNNYSLADISSETVGKVMDECEDNNMNSLLANVAPPPPVSVPMVSVVVKETESSVSNSVVVTTASATTLAEELSSGKKAMTMDENIFQFNKILIDSVYNIICFLYPVRGKDRDFARFFVLETVARVPYFAYLSVLHLQETFGERHMDDKMRTHYAEADNELHHLLIMEELGGNSSVIDRTIAQTMAFFYYWYVVAVYAFSQEAAYHLSELIEDHAFNTYNKYLTDHSELLKTKAVPKIAMKYYVEDNPFLFDLFCTVKDTDDDGNFSTRRPQLESLYDVFVNIRDDEKEHWKTLCNLVQYGDMQGVENKMVEGTKPAPAPTT